MRRVISTLIGAVMLVGIGGTAASAVTIDTGALVTDAGVHPSGDGSAALGNQYGGLGLVCAINNLFTSPGFNPLDPAWFGVFLGVVTGTNHDYDCSAADLRGIIFNDDPSYNPALDTRIIPAPGADPVLTGENQYTG